MGPTLSGCQWVELLFRDFSPWIRASKALWPMCAAVCRIQKRGLLCWEHLLTAVHHVQVRVLAQLPQLQRGINRQQKILSSLPQR